jgi:hypothetical protein
MADDIVSLNFNNKLYNGSAVAVGNYSGTLNVDYTTGAVVGGSVTVKYTPTSSTYTIPASAFANVSSGASAQGVQYAFSAGAATTTSNPDGTTTRTLADGAFFIFYNNQLPSQIGVTGATAGSSVTYDKNLVQVSSSGNFVNSYPGAAPNTSTSLASLIGQPVTSAQVSGAPCYAAGTLIRTTRGDVPVEKLRLGDLAITASGEARPIVWLGHREVDCLNHPNPRSVWPVRISANAFGRGLPERDLYVSPGHSLCVSVIDDALIQAGDLVNGATVARVEVAMADYWHVELQSHDILLANGLPAESYLDADNRGFFVGAQDDLDSSGGSDWLGRFCRPCVNQGPVLEAVRAQLVKRAENLGWRRDAEAELRVNVDGVEARLLQMGDAVVFLFPASAQEVRLLSRAFCPADMLAKGDGRRLGVKLLSLSIGDGVGAWRRINLDDPRLERGFHAVETANGASWRWTDGDAVLPRSLWAEFSGEAIKIRLNHDASAVRGWIAPQATSEPMQRPRLYAVA